MPLTRKLRLPAGTRPGRSVASARDRQDCYDASFALRDAGQSSGIIDTWTRSARSEPIEATQVALSASARPCLMRFRARPGPDTGHPVRCADVLSAIAMSCVSSPAFWMAVPYIKKPEEKEGRTVSPADKYQHGTYKDHDSQRSCCHRSLQSGHSQWSLYLCIRPDRPGPCQRRADRRGCRCPDPSSAAEPAGCAPGGWQLACPRCQDDRLSRAHERFSGHERRLRDLFSGPRTRSFIRGGGGASAQGAG